MIYGRQRPVPTLAVMMPYELILTGPPLWRTGTRSTWITGTLLRQFIRRSPEVGERVVDRLNAESADARCRQLAADQIDRRSFGKSATIDDAAFPAAPGGSTETALRDLICDISPA